jgi:hypothetical protein
MEIRRTEGLRRMAHVLDELVRIPGTNIRFGVDALLGLVPGGGDVAGGLMTAYTLLVAARVGAPSSVILRLAGNIVLDTIVGAVPLLGDAFDIGWKANRRNVTLLERYMASPEPVRKSSRLVVALALVAILAVLAGSVLLAVWSVRILTSLF